MDIRVMATIAALAALLAYLVWAAEYGSRRKGQKSNENKETRDQD